MAWTKIVGKGMKLPELQNFIDAMEFKTWRPNGLVLHNTGAPRLSQWHIVSGAIRMRNLENYYKNQRGWSSAPHAFVADDFVWPFTPFNARGTHSPSWNGTKIGIEMVGDFSTEDPTAGPGLKVYTNTVALFGMLHAKLGLDPDTIKLHKEDPRTTHDCPGKNISKAKFIEDVKEWMGHGGDLHEPELPILPESPDHLPKIDGVVTGVPAGDYLNVRDRGGASGQVLYTLNNGDPVAILGSEMNGETKWYRLAVGWASARFIKEKK